eukprot:TRINITY_DN76167_c0_g1_i1.p1 TRINITY_DN76167_c0_g1~~TRINITY_DN76167_c0_g1_i1.p1  ORF type:complete len:2005 (+),score=297.81 TRINITY_DN76167_c0_g1_i1:59-6016(+)
MPCLLLISLFLLALSEKTQVEKTHSITQGLLQVNQLSSRQATSKVDKLAASRLHSSGATEEHSVNNPKPEPSFFQIAVTLLAFPFAVLHLWMQFGPSLSKEKSAAAEEEETPPKPDCDQEKQKQYPSAGRDVSSSVQEVQCSIKHLVPAFHPEHCPEAESRSSLWNYFDHSSSDKPALVDAAGLLPDLTHRAMHRLINHQALALKQLLQEGAKKAGGSSDDNIRMAIVLDQGPGALLSLLICFAAEIHLVVPVDPKFSLQEFARVFSDETLGLNSVLTSNGTSAKSARLAAEEAGLLLMTAVPSAWSSNFNMEYVPASFVTKGAPLAGQESSMALSTSGTTGRPKWVEQPAVNMLIGAKLIAGSLELCETDQELGVMPLHHIGGISTALASLISGGSLLYAESFEPTTFCKHLKGATNPSHEPTWYYAAPTIHLNVSEAVAEAKPKHHLRFARSGAAALPPSLNERLRDVLGCQVLPTCSMTECMPVCSTTLRNSLPLTSVGPPIGPSLRISGAGGKPLAYGSLGEVLIKQSGLVTPGYLGQAYSESFTEEGWLRTGDLGQLDADGNLELTGRSKEVINRAGETISPSEVEDALLRIPKISDAMALSVPSEEFGEVVGAAIVLESPESRVSLTDIWSALENQTVRQLWPEVIIYMEEIPKGRTGKKQRLSFAAAFKLAIGTPVAPAAFVAVVANNEESPFAFRSVETGLSLGSTPIHNDASCTERHSNEVEVNGNHHKLSVIWRHVLGMPKDQVLDWDVSLWVLGGNSSMLAAIVAQLRAEFNLRPEQLTLTGAMSKPTLNGLASLLDSALGVAGFSEPCTNGAPTAAEKIVVPLASAVQEGATEGCAIVLACAGRQSTPAALDLGAARLGPLAVLLPQTRMYGIERPGSGTWNDVSFEDVSPEMVPGIVSQQAEAVVKTFGTGRSFVLLGTSRGGVWAYWLGVQLQRMGCTIDRLVLSDSAAPTEDPEPHQKQAEQITEFFSNHPSDEEIKKFHDHLNINTVGKFDAEEAGIQKGWQEKLLRFWVWDNLAYCHLLEHCSPKAGSMPAQLDCPIAIFNATEETIFWRRVHDKHEWMQFTSTGPFEIFDVPTNHDGMLKHILTKLGSNDAEMFAMWERLVKPQEDLSPGKSSAMCCPWQHVAQHDSASLSLIDETERRLDYKHVISAAEALACSFRAQGLEQGNRVLVIGEVGSSCLIAQLALVHCGATAVLIGVGESSTYLAQVAETAACSHAIILAGDLQASDIPCELGELIQDAAAGRPTAPAFVQRSSPATILFSSGSTGKPKGVVQSYSTLLALAADMSKNAVPTLWKGSIAWIANYALPHVLAGQHLLVVPRPLQLEPHSFQALRRRHDVQTLTMAPSELRAQLATPDCLSDLKSITCIAEALPPAVALEFFKQYPHVKLLETYASSEVQGSNAFLSTEVSQDGCTGRFNVRPSQTVILVDPENPSQKVQVPGKAGELLLQPTASGYLDSNQTSQRFIPNSFGPGKLFRTGDICKWTIVGKQLQLCGRVDFQVKVSGKLVELEHVERAAEALPGIQQAAARTFVRSSGTMVIALFVVPVADSEIGTMSSSKGTAHLKEKMQEVLPAHAVPATISFLEEIPLLKNGKKDRASLPEPEEEEDVLVVDSIGMMQHMGAREAKEALLRDSFAGLIALSLGPGHLAKDILPTISPMTFNLVANVNMKLFFMLVGYMDGRNPPSRSDFILRSVMLIVAYLLMGVPNFILCLYTGYPYSQWLEQRWTCILVLLGMLINRSSASFRVHPLAASICLYAASLPAHWLDYLYETGIWSDETAARHPALLLLLGPPGWSCLLVVSQLLKLLGHYMACLYIGRTWSSNFLQRIMGRDIRVGVLSAIIFFCLCQLTFIPDADKKLQNGEVKSLLWALPELLAEWVQTVSLLFCLGPGNRFLALLGQNIVGNYLIHVTIKFQYGWLISLAPPGAFYGVSMILLGSAAYVLTVGYAMQRIVVRIVHSLQGRSKSA